MESEAEVVVVGGGLAGAATALRLADAGHHVLVLDRAGFPRSKVCGEGLLPHGVVALAEAGVEPPAGARPFVGIRWTHGEVTAVGRFPRGSRGLGLRRDHLDHAMLERAGRHPRIEVQPGREVRGLGREGGRLVLRTAVGAVRARVVVGADGLHSRIRRWAGLEAPLRGPRRYGVRQHYTLPVGSPDPEWVDVLVVDGAELYVTPVGPAELNVAALCGHEQMDRFKGRLAGAFADLVRRSPLGERLREAAPAGDVAATGPLRRSASGVVADGVVLVGDAAGFVDGITGEGMSIALHTAALAAEVVSGALRAGSVGADRLRPYAIRRARLVRDANALTELVLFGMRHRALATRVVRGLRRHPELFDRLLAVEVGEVPLASFGLGRVMRLVLA